MDKDLKNLLVANHKELLTKVEAMLVKQIASRIEETNKRLTAVEASINRGVTSVNTSMVKEIASRIEETNKQIRGSNVLLDKLVKRK